MAVGVLRRQHVHIGWNVITVSCASASCPTTCSGASTPATACGLGHDAARRRPRRAPHRGPLGSHRGVLDQRPLLSALCFPSCSSGRPTNESASAGSPLEDVGRERTGGDAAGRPGVELADDRVDVLEPSASTMDCSMASVTGPRCRPARAWPAATSAGRRRSSGTRGGVSAPTAVAICSGAPTPGRRIAPERHADPQLGVNGHTRRDPGPRTTQAAMWLSPRCSRASSQARGSRPIGSAGHGWLRRPENSGRPVPSAALTAEASAVVPPG